MIATNTLTAATNEQLEELYNTMIIPFTQESEEMKAVQREVTAAVAAVVKDTIAISGLNEIITELEGRALFDGFACGFRYAAALLGGRIGGNENG